MFFYFDVSSSAQQYEVKYFNVILSEEKNRFTIGLKIKILINWTN